jgi:hypothetical protein
MNSLNIIGVIVSPSPSHAPRADMVRNDIAVIREFGAAEGAFAALGTDLSVEQFPHFRIRAEFAISPWVLSIVDSSNAKLPGSSRFRYHLPAAAG